MRVERKGGAANMEGHHAAGSVGDEMKAKGERKVGREGTQRKTVVECDGSAAQQARWKTWRVGCGGKREALLCGGAVMGAYGERVFRKP